MRAFSLQDNTARREIITGIVIEVVFSLLLCALCWLIACALQLLPRI